jgi:hypothetical protein
MTTIGLKRPGAITAGDMLALVHERWMQQVTDYLTPALEEQADFWARWGGARYLADQFRDRFELERDFVQTVLPMLPDETARSLETARAELERTRAELDAVARKREGRRPTAALARRFIEQLAMWCVEIELAMAHVAAEELPTAARRRLDHLWVADALMR